MKDYKNELLELIEKAEYDAVAKDIARTALANAQILDTDTAEEVADKMYKALDDLLAIDNYDKAHPDYEATWIQAHYERYTAIESTIDLFDFEHRS